MAARELPEEESRLHVLALEQVEREPVFDQQVHVQVERGLMAEGLDLGEMFAWAVITDGIVIISVITEDIIGAVHGLHGIIGWHLVTQSAIIGTTATMMTPV